MDWLQSLFTTTDSIPHIVVLYALVIAIGVALGKLKFGGISLGVTFVLFAGIVVGHIYNANGIADPDGGLACPKSVLLFLQEFGLILFVYCIGLQVGPGFFQSFKKGGVQMILMAIGIVLLNVLTMLGLYYLVFDTNDKTSLPMAVGMLYGAVTNTPGLGAANEAIKSMGIDMGNLDIASSYACAYPLGVVGIIGATIALRYICGVKLEKEEEEIRKSQGGDPHVLPYRASIQVTNEALIGKTLAQLSEMAGRSFTCTRIKRGDEIFCPTHETRLSIGDVLNTISAQDDADAVIKCVGEQVKMDWHLSDSPIVGKRILVTQSNVNGKTMGQLNLRALYGVNITRVTRSGMELFVSPSLHLQIGDRLMVVGEEENVNRVADVLGNSIKRLDHPNVGAIFFGILVGVVFGMLPIAIPGMSTPLKLGIAGGPLVIAILLGCYSYKFHLVTYTTTSANLLLREIGLVLFLASVGIKAGAGFWNTVTQGDGLTYVWAGFLVTVIPLIIMGLVGRFVFKFNYFTLMGIIAGSTTDPPALGYANSVANNDAPSVGYSTVYPLSMFLRILVAQSLILFLCVA